MKILNSCKLVSGVIRKSVYLFSFSLMLTFCCVQGWAQTASELDPQTMQDLRQTLENHVNILKTEINNSVPGVDVETNAGIIAYYDRAMHLYMTEDVNLNYAFAWALDAVSPTDDASGSAASELFFASQVQSNISIGQYNSELMELNTFRRAAPGLQPIIAGINISSGNMASVNALVSYIQQNK